MTGWKRTAELGLKWLALACLALALAAGAALVWVPFGAWGILTLKVMLTSGIAAFGLWACGCLLGELWGGGGGS